MSAKIQGLLFNEDCSDFFFTHAPEEVTGENLDAYIDHLADAGVSGLFCNVNAQRTNYDSKVWESFWHNLDPDGPDDQPRLRNVLREEVAVYRKQFSSFLTLHERGIDYPARVIELGVASVGLSPG